MWWLVAVVLQTVTIGSTEAIAFDYNDADLSTFQVVRFEAAWDNQAYVALTPTAIVLADTLPGSTTYKVVPPFTNGTHTVTFRACSSEVCGVASDPFPFAYVVAVPTSPSHVRSIRVGP
jgi:hypothetical protein